MQQHTAHPVTQQHIHFAHWKLNQLSAPCYNCYFAAEAIGSYDLARHVCCAWGGIYCVYMLGACLHSITDTYNAARREA
jgi:hypothetical protein